jgi:hypothetical protein
MTLVSISAKPDGCAAPVGAVGISAPWIAE